MVSDRKPQGMARHTSRQQRTRLLKALMHGPEDRYGSLHLGARGCALAEAASFDKLIAGGLCAASPVAGLWAHPCQLMG